MDLQSHFQLVSWFLILVLVIHDVWSQTQNRNYPVNEESNYVPTPTSREDLLKSLTQLVIDEELGLYLSPCEKGWVFNFFNGKCLHFQDGDRKNWYEAKYKCRSLGGALASFQDRQDLLFLSRLATIGGSSQNSSRIQAWIGGHSTAGNPWAWDSGEPWGNVDLHVQGDQNPAKEDTCLAVTYDDNDGAVYVNLSELPAKLECGGSQLHYVCQKGPILVDGINKFNHYPQPTLPLPEMIEKLYNKPQQPYRNPRYSTPAMRNPYEPFLSGRTEANVPGTLDSTPFIPLFEVVSDRRYKRNVRQPYQQAHPASQPPYPGQNQIHLMKPTPYEAKPPQYQMKQVVSSDAEIIKMHASKILQKELAYKWRPCPNGWTYYWAVDKCYYTSKNELRTWEESRERCRTLGGTLASFHSRLEMHVIRELGTIGNYETAKSFSAWTGGHYVERKGWRWDDEEEFWGDMDAHIHDDYYDNPPAQNLCMAVFNDDARGAGLVDPYTRIPYDCKSYRMPFVCQMPPIRPSNSETEYYENVYQKSLVSHNYPTLDKNDVRLIRTYVQGKLNEMLSPCEEGWIFFPFSGRCFFSDPRLEYSWFAARDYCASKGGTLGSFHSRSEMIFINSLCTVGKMTYYPESSMRKTGYEKTKECWVGLASINGEPWKWDDNSAIDMEAHLPILVSPEVNNTCVVVYPDDWYGAGYGRFANQAPTLDLTERMDCHRDRRPFVCQKLPLGRQKQSYLSTLTPYHKPAPAPTYGTTPSPTYPTSSPTYNPPPMYNQRFQHRKPAYKPHIPPVYKISSGSLPSNARYPGQFEFTMF